MSVISYTAFSYWRDFGARFLRASPIPAAGVAMGSASQDYITNTHSKYFPMPQDKLVNTPRDKMSSHL